MKQIRVHTKTNKRYNHDIWSAVEHFTKPGNDIIDSVKRGNTEIIYT